MNNLKTARQDWKIAAVEKMYEMPFMDLLFTAQSIHRANFLPNQIQVSTLLSRKTGARPFNILCQ